MKHKNKSVGNAPRCVFCGRSNGAQFNIFTPRFQPFGTACVDCEKSLPPGTQVPEINLAAPNQQARGFILRPTITETPRTLTPAEEEKRAAYNDGAQAEADRGRGIDRGIVYGGDMADAF